MSFIGKWRKKAISMYGTNRGLTKAQRDKVTAATPGHARKTSKSTRKTSSTSKTKTKKSSSGTGRRKMARKKRRVSRKMTIPLAVVAPVVAGVVGPTVYGTGSPLDAAMAGDYGAAMNRLSINFTGYNFDDASWDLNRANALKGTIIGLFVHKFVGGAPLNLNRILARHNIPFIRI